MPTAPKYVATSWWVGNFSPYPGGPIITPESVYISDQPTMDAVGVAAVAAAVTLTYSDTGPSPLPLPQPAEPFIIYNQAQSYLTDTQKTQARTNIGAFTATGIPTYVGTRAKTFDPLTGLYNATAITVRKAQLLVNSTKQGGSCRITFIGDSETGGTGATAVTAWPRQLRNALAMFGCTVRGTGLTFAGSGVTDSRWTTTGTVTNSGLFSTIATGASQTFTSDTAGVNIDIWYYNSGGSFTYVIDGGAPTTVTVTGGSTTGVVHLTGLANTTHTVRIAPTAGACFLIAVSVFNATGLLCNNAGMPSTQTSDWTGTGFVTKFQQATLDTPDVAFVSLGVVDSGSAVALATYESRLTTVVNNCTALGASVILLAEPQPSSVALATWKTYVNSQYNVADALDLPLIDTTHRMGDYTIANGFGLMYDTTHPNAKGYASHAAAALALLGV